MPMNDILFYLSIVDTPQSWNELSSNKNQVDLEWKWAPFGIERQSAKK